MNCGLERSVRAAPPPALPPLLSTASRFSLGERFSAFLRSHSHLCLPLHGQSPRGMSTWPQRCQHRDSRLEMQGMLGAALSSLLGWVVCRGGACTCWDKGNLEPLGGADRPKDSGGKDQQCHLNPESGCTGSHEPWTIMRGSQ